MVRDRNAGSAGPVDKNRGLRFLTGHALFGFFANLQRLMSFCFERRVVFKMSPKVISCIHALTWAGGSKRRDDREARLESSPDGQCVQGGRRMAAQRCT